MIQLITMGIAQVKLLSCMLLLKKYPIPNNNNNIILDVFVDIDSVSLSVLIYITPEIMMDINNTIHLLLLIIKSGIFVNSICVYLDRI